MISLRRDNSARVEAGWELVQKYIDTQDADVEDVLSTITDAVTDILHYAHEQGIDVKQLLKTAESHFEFEVNS